MESFCMDSVPMSNKIKKMYTNQEIEIIFKNCKTTAELLFIGLIFNQLIKDGSQERSDFLSETVNFRFRELEKL